MWLAITLMNALLVLALHGNIIMFREKDNAVPLEMAVLEDRCTLLLMPFDYKYRGRKCYSLSNTFTTQKLITQNTASVVQAK